MSVAETVNFAHTCHSGFGQPEFNLTGELSKAKVGEEKGIVRKGTVRKGSQPLRVLSE
jgi:hypothetical protein